MKPRTLRSLVGATLVLGLAASLALAAEPTGSPAQAGTPVASPVGEASKGKKAKLRKDTGDNTLAPKVRKAKEIPFPLPIGRDAHNMRIPSYDTAGKLLSMLEMANAHRVDNEHVQLEAMTFNLSATDSQDAYKVVMPVSIFDLKTNIVTGNSAVTIETKQFELTGERATFNTVERSGVLQGHVHMVIHNLKQVATPGQPSADPQ